MVPDKLPGRRRILFALATAGIVILAIAVMGEVMIRVINPRPVMYPRFKISRQYGLTVYENEQITHELPGKWKFIYSVNAYGYRGRAVPISNAYEKQNIVVLGDSYTFGEGVPDGTEYPQILAQRLSNRFNVINLGSPGWGLTQEIRRFYEFGQLYNPTIVILQFCINDPTDNLEFMVTTTQDDHFVFRDVENIESTGIKKYLSHSFLQKLQIYNLISEFTFRSPRKIIQEQAGQLRDTSQIPVEQGIYCMLLEAFVRDLTKRRVKFLMISQNRNLEAFPFIYSKVASLCAAGKMEHFEVDDWVKDVKSLLSPEGHWGEGVHLVIGNRIADVIEAEHF